MRYRKGNIPLSLPLLVASDKCNESVYGVLSIPSLLSCCTPLPSVILGVEGKLDSQIKEPGIEVAWMKGCIGQVFHSIPEPETSRFG